MPGSARAQVPTAGPHVVGARSVAIFTHASAPLSLRPVPALVPSHLMLVDQLRRFLAGRPQASHEFQRGSHRPPASAFALLLLFEELRRLRAAAVDLVPAHHVDPAPTRHSRRCRCRSPTLP